MQTAGPAESLMHRSGWGQSSAALAGVADQLILGTSLEEPLLRTWLQNVPAASSPCRKFMGLLPLLWT